MLKKIVIGLLLTSSLLAETELWKFLKYSTAYASFSLNAPRYQDDRFAIIGGLSTGDLVVERTERDLKPDFQSSIGLRKIARFQYEPKRGIRNAGKGGEWYDGTEQNANESASFGPVKGWEYLAKWSEGRQWGNDYINQEYWVRYIGKWAMAKVGWTELGLEDISYAHGDLRFHWTPEKLNNKFHLSIGLKHRQHPVYGFDAMVLDTSWYRGQWWQFAENAFGIDDNMWYQEDMLEGYDEEGNPIWKHDELLELVNGEWVKVEGDGPFWNGRGEYWGHDWLWRDVDGRIFAYTDREYFIYHFPQMLEKYIGGIKKDLGYQSETSLVLGADFYHYGESWWLHAWGNWLPYHYGHSKHAYHNADSYNNHIEDGKEPYDFMYMDPMWMSWNDYDLGAIFGVKIQDNLGVFAEGRYLYYWEKPAYDIKLGVNYQFIGF